MKRRPKWDTNEKWIKIGYKLRKAKKGHKERGTKRDTKRKWDKFGRKCYDFQKGQTEFGRKGTNENSFKKKYVWKVHQRAKT